jgi:hypothetical protein
LDVNKKYSGGINTFLNGILTGLSDGRISKNYIIYCSKDNEIFFKKYKPFFKIKTFDYKKNFYYSLIIYLLIKFLMKYMIKLKFYTPLLVY